MLTMTEPTAQPAARAPRRSPLSSVRRVVALIVVGSLIVLAVARYRVGPSADATPPGALSPAEAFDDLVANAPVERLVRLIAYDSATAGQLSIDHLKMLGPPHEQYVFVADYNELKGYTVEQAIAKLGGQYQPGTAFSAIIFPVGQREVVPASSRGLLQVIELVDRSNKGQPDYTAADLGIRLSPDDFAALAIRDRASWDWQHFAPYYRTYTATVAQLRREKCSAFGHIGQLDADWQSLGYAEVERGRDLPAPDFTLELDGKPLRAARFGARALLVANEEIDSIAGRVLIDFQNPREERIPLFGEAASETAGHE
jgi:hypothetical protein